MQVIYCIKNYVMRAQISTAKKRYILLVILRLDRRIQRVDRYAETVLGFCG